MQRGIVAAAVALGGLVLALRSGRSPAVSADDLAARRLGQDSLALQPSAATGGAEDASFFESLFDAPVHSASASEAATATGGDDPVFVTGGLTAEEIQNIGL